MQRKNLTFLLLSLFLSCNNKKSVDLNYEKKSAVEKIAILKKHISSTEHKILPPLEKADILSLIFKSLGAKMDLQSDFAPEGWVKSIHKRAAIANIAFKPIENDYTGIFQSGAMGFLRVSLTFDPKTKGVAPGLALKLLIDGKPSQNISLLTSLDGQGQNYNIFANPFSTIVPPSKILSAKIVAYLFRRVTDKFNGVDVTGLATFNRTGIKVTDVRAPYELILKARESLLGPSLPARDFRNDLFKIKPSNAIFDVYALNSKSNDYWEYSKIPVDLKLKKGIKIGEIVLESKFIASEFSDNQMFFRHQRILK